MTGQTIEKAAVEFPEEIPGFPQFGHIPFEGLHNTRDLGGMPAAEGRRVRPARLLRSGALHHGTEDDLARLLADYRLESVVDFRTPLEREKDPDPRDRMPGVVFYDFPVLSMEAVGVTHGGNVLEDARDVMAERADVHALVREVYKKALLEPEGREAYRSFLTVVLEAEGAVLWHCTEGKDRAGLGAAIVERALGVPEADVRADYLATNLFARTRAEKMLDALAEKFPALRELDTDVDSVFYAYGDYYDYGMAAVREAYGSFDAYLTEGLDFGPERRAALREKYLV